MMIYVVAHANFIGKSYQNLPDAQAAMNKDAVDRLGGADAQWRQDEGFPDRWVLYILRAHFWYRTHTTITESELI